MWYVLQFIIIVGLCILFKSEIAPDRNMGHIFLFSVLVAYAITWLISRAIDQVRTNSRTCFMISLLITAAVIGWPVWQAPEGPLNGSAFVIIGVIGFCIFVPSMWVVSKSILLVRRLQGYPPPARPVKPPVTSCCAGGAMARTFNLVHFFPAGPSICLFDLSRFRSLGRWHQDVPRPRMGRRAFRYQFVDRRRNFACDSDAGHITMVASRRQWAVRRHSSASRQSS
jgi:hypothetical protein